MKDIYSIQEMRELFDKNKHQWGDGVRFEDAVSAELHRFSQFVDTDRDGGVSGEDEIADLISYNTRGKVIALSDKWVSSVWENFKDGKIEDENFIGITYKWLHLPLFKILDVDTDLDEAHYREVIRANLDLNPAYWGNVIGANDPYRDNNKYRLELIAGILQMNSLATKEDIINEIKLIK